MHKILTTLFFTAVVAVGGLSIPANAQITTGEPTSKVIRTGNRASAGDFGLYLGLTSTMVGDMFDGSVKLSALPLINLKYMMTDKAEWRLGLELYKTSSRNEGVISQTWEDNMYDLPLTSRNSSSNAMFYPGFAWHFSSKNILDVYVGAELPIGWDSSTEYSEYGELDIFENPSLPNVLDVKKILSTNKVTKRSFVIGLGAFIGLQAYIADLPLALGLELGISSRFDTGLKYKHEITNTGSEDQIYYTTSLDSDVRYDKLKARTGEINGEVRLTLTYYFK
ncbi:MULTISPECIES: hypothetical protein [unclassified Muribaculum]|uniref:hypothetical protein n=1 Tax=unclassified Muribaculum TaxID=2622126 RepID=UPI00117C3410|nr:MULTISPECIES: hypothetical protein [unclassified Muribaculum]